ncbi:hypothetical protein T03_7630 [Trichinella britovi]|uniref:Uncharacterized protein n=1 Tax=Trichinella britovi TaxID=45882 RepID=A0A0V1DFJ8_TRIBR|nr:hypothetical protein T03_7630 [Trichinella britovi]
MKFNVLKVCYSAVLFLPTDFLLQYWKSLNVKFCSGKIFSIILKILFENISREGTYILVPNTPPLFNSHFLNVAVVNSIFIHPLKQRTKKDILQDPLLILSIALQPITLLHISHSNEKYQEFLESLETLLKIFTNFNFTFLRTSLFSNLLHIFKENTRSTKFN